MVNMYLEFISEDLLVFKKKGKKLVTDWKEL